MPGKPRLPVVIRCRERMCTCGSATDCYAVNAQFWDQIAMLTGLGGRYSGHSRICVKK